MSAGRGAGWSQAARRVAVTGWVIGAAVMAWRLAGEAQDDFFITYRFAENLAAGHGFVFNVGERVFATTAPGWGLLLAGLHWLTGFAVPTLGSFVTALALVLLAGLVVREGERSGRLPEAIVGGSLLLASPFVWSHLGCEWALALALLAVAHELAAVWPHRAGLLAGLAVWCRPDAAVGVVLLVWLLWRAERRRGSRFAIAAGLTIGLGLLWAWSYFGQPLPATLAAKRVHAAASPNFWPGGWLFLGQAASWLAAEWRGVWAACVVAAGLGGIAGTALGGRTLPLLLGVVALAPVVVYPVLGVPFFTWYLLPLFIAMPIGLAALVGEAVRAARQARSWRLAAVALSLALVLLPVVAAGWRLAVSASEFTGFPRVAVYRAAGEWLAANVQPGDELSAIEVGTVGYYAGIPLRDLIGLVSPENLPFVERRDLTAALLAHPTRFLISSTGTAGLIDPILTDPRLAGLFVPVFETRSRAERAVVYRRPDP